MKADRLADVMARFAETINEMVGELRDGGEQDGGLGHEVDYGDHDVAEVKIPEANGVAADTLVQVSSGDLWKLVNRSRKMIRLAREGRVPSMEARAPLCRAIKAIKAQGLAKKPYNLRD